MAPAEGNHGMTALLLFIMTAAAVLLPGGVFPGSAAPAWAGTAARPAQWAVPVRAPGVRNLHKVNDGLYRSAQPTQEGMENLERMGIRTVINLRAFHSDADELKGTALLNEALNVKTWHIENEDIVRVLRILGRKENGPFLVHCQHGADRTGVVCAMYRIVVQHWTKDEAIREMVDGGYGFHPVWKNIIAYLRNVDVDGIRRALADPAGGERGSP
jgi:protein tyrosine/serine phosphatase